MQIRLGNVLDPAIRQCLAYLDGEHCFEPGYLRVATPTSEPVFTTLYACLPDDWIVAPGKLCRCGLLVLTNR